MKKDVVIAVITGFILGGAAAFAAVNLPSLFKVGQKPQQEEVAKDLTPQPTPVTTEAAGNLEITEPKDESIAEDSKLKITGKSRVGDTVVVESETYIGVAKVENDGTFTATLSLSPGGNQITVYSLNESGEETKKLTVYYTSDKL